MEADNNNNNNNNQQQQQRAPEQQLIDAVRRRNSLLVIRALESAPNVNINVQDGPRTQQTPLHQAACNGDLEIVRILLDSHHGVNMEARDCMGCTPIHLAVCERHKHVVTALLDQPGADIETTDNRYKMTPLLLACFQQDYDMALMLVEKGACVSAKNKFDRNVLHFACKSAEPHRDHWVLVSWLIANGAACGVNAKTNSHNTPLHNAAFVGSVGSMRVLLVNGADSDLNAKNDQGVTPLSYAVFGNHLEAVRFLLDYGADIETTDFFGDTLLHDATSIRITEELLQRGVSIFGRASNNRTPFDYAFSRNLPDVYQCILQHYLEKVATNHEKLSLHAIFKAAEYVEVVEQRTVNDNAVTVRTKLISLPVGKLTIQMMLESLLSWFILQDPDMIALQDQDNHRSIPLHILCQDAGDAPIELVRWLVEQDVPTLHYTDSRGRLPLHLAAHARAPLETFQYLVQQGGVGTLYARDLDRALPLHLMVSRVSSTTTDDDDSSPPPKLDAVQYLLKEYPGSVKERNNKGELPIMLACHSSAPEGVLFVLLKANPDSLANMIEFYNA